MVMCLLPRFFWSTLNIRPNDNSRQYSVQVFLDFSDGTWNGQLSVKMAVLCEIPWNFAFSSFYYTPRGERNIVMTVYVCLSVRQHSGISGTIHARSSSSFLAALRYVHTCIYWTAPDRERSLISTIALLFIHFVIGCIIAHLNLIHPSQATRTVRAMLNYRWEADDWHLTDAQPTVDRT